MKDATIAGQSPRTEKDYESEINRLSIEIRQMLDETRRNHENSKRLGQKNRQRLDDLEKMIQCWKD